MKALLSLVILFFHLVSPCYTTLSQSESPDRNDKIYFQTDSVVNYYGSIHALTLRNIGKIHQKLNEPEKALTNFSEAMKILDMDSDLLDICHLSILRAESFFRSGLLDSAIYYLNTAGFILENQAFDDIYRKAHLETDLYRSYSEIYSAWDEHERALNYYKQYRTAQRKIYDWDWDRERVEFLARNELERKEKKNELLRRNNTIQKLRLSKQRLNLGVTALVLIIAITALLIMYFRFRLKKKISKVLEYKVAEALDKQKEQQKIIIHQSGLTSLGEMAAGIAHEINQPLQSVSLAIERIDYQNKYSEKQEAEINSITENIKSSILKIKTIVDHIRIFSSQQKGDVREVFSINVPIENALNIMKPQLENRQIEIRMNLDQDAGLISGNPYKFEQVVVNLLNNARDALEARPVKEAQQFTRSIGIITRQEKGSVVMEISDNGTGIPEKDLTRIFLPFYSTREREKASGLGLAIAHGIIKEINGMIYIKPNEQGGTTFIVKTPVQSPTKISYK